MVSALGHDLEAGRISLFTVGSNGDQSFYDRGAHPAHRSWMQHQWDEYVRWEVIPFIHDRCQGQIPIATMGASLGAYHAANTLFKHPDLVKACYATSGLYDMRGFMDGFYDDNLYFNNPVDYLANQNDPWWHEQIASCDVHIATGHGPWEHPEQAHALTRVLNSKGIPHSFDDWGAMGGHDWPYWRYQMRSYLGG